MINKQDIKRVLKITRTDLLSFFLFITPIVLILLSLIPLFFGDISFTRRFGQLVELNSESSIFFFRMLIIGLPIILFFYIKRIYFIFRLLNSGKETLGKIDGVHYSKDRTSALIHFLLKDKEYFVSSNFMKSSLTANFVVGEEIEIIYDPNNPRNAIIKKLFV